uniref:Uncharacterized protein n=1 Tax=Anguilla anguilla TaxID=7936 RepID=A0A0E9TRA4_ANGAN
MRKKESVMFSSAFGLSSANVIIFSIIYDIYLDYDIYYLKKMVPTIIYRSFTVGYLCGHL